MRILYLADIRFPLERANGIQTAETCYALAERGHAVTLGVRPDVRRPARDPFDFYGLPRVDRLVITRAQVRGPMWTRRLGYLCFALWRACRADHDVVFTRDLTAADVLMRVPRTRRPPVVYESHGFAPAVGEAFSRLLSGATSASPRKQQRLHARERRVWRGADGYVTITAALATELVDRFGPRPHLETIPDGVRLRSDRQFHAPRPSPTPLVAYSGHFYPWKGVDVLLQALAELPNVRGLLIGGHPAEEDLARMQALATSLGLDQRVAFTGLVDPARVPSLLADADVLVAPNVAAGGSARYTSPLKLFEYMAAGKPIVASDLPAFREVVRDNEDACLVEPGKPDALARGIRRVLDDMLLAERIARNAFDRAPAYAWARRAERIEELLEEVVRAVGHTSPLPRLQGRG